MRDAAVWPRAHASARAPRAPVRPRSRNPWVAICAQVLDSSLRRERCEASLTPGTCSDRLWLLPSGPDQVHQTAMRGGPPITLYVIGAASQAAVSSKTGAGMRRGLMCKRRILLHRAKRDG